MMKAEEYLLKAAYSEELTEAEKDIAFYEIGFYREDILRAMKEYAKEAIKLDRAWVAENAQAFLKESLMTQQRVTAEVDKDSIINCPNILIA